MINPSVFFTDLKCSAIKHIPKLPTDSYVPWIICDCNAPKISAWKPEENSPVDMAYRQVVLEPKTLMFNEQGIVFWTGLCPGCKTWFWHSKTWDWVGWMNDLQTCKMLLNTIPLQHILSEGRGVAGISIHAGTRLFFEYGKLTNIDSFK